MIGWELGSPRNLPTDSCTDESGTSGCVERLARSTRKMWCLAAAVVAVVEPANRTDWPGTARERD